MIMAASNFHRNHDQHICISEKLSEELKKTGQDVLTQINNLNQETANQIIIKMANKIVGGIYGIIPDLQEIVIKSSTENENNANLKDVLKHLSEYCNEMMQTYDSDPSTNKQIIIIFIQNILLEAEGLLNIIKTDSLHDFKHELVENFKEILYMIHLGEVRIRIENYNQQQLKKLAEDIRQNFFQDISIIENCSLDVFKTLMIHVKYNVKHILQAAYYLNKVANNYQDINIQHKILEAANLLNSATTSALFINEKLTDTKVAVQANTQWCLNCWDAIKMFFEFNDLAGDNINKSTENLRDLVKYIISYGIVINENLGKSIKNDSLFS